MQKYIILLLQALLTLCSTHIIPPSPVPPPPPRPTEGTLTHIKLRTELARPPARPPISPVVSARYLALRLLTLLNIRSRVSCLRSANKVNSFSDRQQAPLRLARSPTSRRLGLIARKRLWGTLGASRASGGVQAAGGHHVESHSSSRRLVSSLLPVFVRSAVRNPFAHPASELASGRPLLKYMAFICHLQN